MKTTEDQLCVDCKKRPVAVKKHSLCKACYQKKYAAGNIPKEEKVGGLICVQCNVNPVANKKRGLCARCNSARHQKHSPKIDSREMSIHLMGLRENEGEVEFIKRYFDHANWIHQPAIFRLNGQNYSPDFYDGERNTFIEVSRTRQAYFYNKPKYKLMRQLFPKINFEIRRPTGEILDETKSINPQL